MINNYKLKIKGYNKGVITVVDDSSEIRGQSRQSSFGDIISDFLHVMENESLYSDKRVNVDRGFASVRNRGSWSSFRIPDDYCEEDGYIAEYSDLDEEWMRKLKRIHKGLMVRYQDVKIDISTSERNWIDLKIYRR